jgi:hypothetical protein
MISPEPTMPREETVAKGMAQLLLGRHGPNDHYLGGRYYRTGRGRRQPRVLAFPLGGKTIHLFESLIPSQRREPVPAQRIFPKFSTRYELTAFSFARKVESAGGKSYNAESRPSAKLDRRYAELYEAAQRADLAFFKRPVYAVYLELMRAEERFGALRESLIEGNIEHFASRGNDVVARLGRMHSAIRRLAGRGIALTAQIGAGSFFPEQVLKRKLSFGLPVGEEDRMRAYIDRLLRLLPLWDAGVRLPSHGLILSLAGAELAAVRDRCEAAVEESGGLPRLRDLLGILASVTGYRPETDRPRGDPRFERLRRRRPQGSGSAGRARAAAAAERSAPGGGGA